MKGTAKRPGEALARLFYAASSGNGLSRNMGRVSRVRFPPVVIAGMIRSYCAVYDVALDEAEVPPGGFVTFNDFFTRRLKPGSREIDPDPDTIASPCDGRVLAAGKVEKGLALQAKGMTYPLARLLGDETLCKGFEGGRFLTIYLSPSDYHRVHFPCDGEVVRCVHMPGRLYTVAPRAASILDDLLCRNERIDTVLRTRFGTVAIVMVGATGVGHVTMSYSDAATNTGRCSGTTSFDPPIAVAKGDDLGVFNLGSTVVLVVQEGGWEVLHPEVGGAVLMGQGLLKSRG